jgi:hypothetical protein
MISSLQPLVALAIVSVLMCAAVALALRWVDTSKRRFMVRLRNGSEHPVAIARNITEEVAIPKVISAIQRWSQPDYAAPSRRRDTADADTTDDLVINEGSSRPAQST